jgi:hypothetical protein
VSSKSLAHAYSIAEHKPAFFVLSHTSDLEEYIHTSNIIKKILCKGDKVEVAVF